MNCERVKSQNFSNTMDALEALDLERTKGVRAFFEQSPFLWKEALWYKEQQQRISLRGCPRIRV